MQPPEMVAFCFYDLSQGQIIDQASEAQRILDIANSAYSRFMSCEPMEQGALLRALCSKYLVSARRIMPVYRKPFELVRRRACVKEWIEYLSMEAEPIG